MQPRLPFCEVSSSFSVLTVCAFEFEDCGFLDCGPNPTNFGSGCFRGIARENVAAPPDTEPGVESSISVSVILV